EVVNLLEKEKANLKTVESLKLKDLESSENVISESKNQSENDCLVVEKECDKEENPKVIAPKIFKLSVSQCVSPISMSKTSCESNNVEIKLKRKRRKRKSSKQNDKQVYNDVSRANSDFVHFLDLDTFSGVRRPKHSGVIWKKKWSSDTSNVDLSAVSHSKLNKTVKRYSRKDLLACNNSHLKETSSASVCNDAMNVSCNSRMCDLLDDNNFFIFNDESVKISPVSKMPFRKKPCDSMITVHMIMPSKDNLYNGRKGIGFENPSYFEKAKDLRPSLYDEKVIGLGYTPMFLTHLDEALEIEKFKRSRENKIEFAYDYGNLNASYVNEKINFEDDYFQEIINLDFEKMDSLFQQTGSLKPYVSNVILEKIIIDLEDKVVNLFEKKKQTWKQLSL
nr:hypothetical protein [Tanacetum cinerariifolium]